MLARPEVTGKSIAGQLADAIADGGWRSRARPSQLPPPGDWNGWLVMAGRFRQNAHRPRALSLCERTQVPNRSEFEMNLSECGLIARPGDKPGVVRARAKTRGVVFGRKPKLTSHQRREALERRAGGESVVEIARTYNVAHSTISRLQERPAEG
jgi:predicted RNA polymerase sigma factor